MKIRFCQTLIILGLVNSATLQANKGTYHGTVISRGGPGFQVPSFAIGDRFEVTYAFDPYVKDAVPSDPTVGHYPNAVESLAFTVGSYSGSTGRADIQVGKDFTRQGGVKDYYRIIVSRSLTGPAIDEWVLTEFDFSLADPTHTAFSSDALPVAPPNTARFQDRYSTFMQLCFTGSAGVSSCIVARFDQQFTVSITTFIPFNHTLPYVLLDAPPPCPPPCDSEPLPWVTFKGDDRGFASDAESFRTRQTVTVATENPDIILSKPTVEIHPSNAYPLEALIDNVIDDTDIPVASATADPSGISMVYGRLDDHTIWLDFYGSIANPLAVASPKIDWCYKVEISTGAYGAGIPRYRIYGGHDDYPAYEVYINDEAIDLYMPPRNDALRLFGACDDIPIDKQCSAGSCSGGEEPSARKRDARVVVRQR